MGKVGELEHQVNSCCLVGFSEEDAVLQEEPGGKEEAPQVVDLQQLVPVGGVYHIHALQLPPQVQDVGDWSMVEVREERDQPLLPWPPEELLLRVVTAGTGTGHDFLSSKLPRQGLQIIRFSHVKGKSTKVVPQSLLVQLQVLQAG